MRLIQSVPLRHTVRCLVDMSVHSTKWITAPCVRADVAVPEADDALSPALLRQETFTPRASERLNSGRLFFNEHESV